METVKEQIRRLEEEITELKARWPAHSVQAWQVLRLEELEETLAQLYARLNAGHPSQAGDEQV